MKYKAQIIELFLDFLQTVPWKCDYNQSQCSKAVKVANYKCTVCQKENKASERKVMSTVEQFIWKNLYSLDLRLYQSQILKGPT